MEQAQNRLAIVGMNRLFREIVASVLSEHGWDVLDSDQTCLGPDEALEIVLIACPVEVEAVIDNIRRVHADFPAGKVVLLGVNATDADLIRFIEAGARAFVAGDQGMTELIHTLEMVRKNQTPCSGGITELIIGAIHRLDQEHHPGIPCVLTPREKEILQLISNGLSNKEIATQLHIAPNTVKNHVHHLLHKLKVGSRHDAAWMQIRPRRHVPHARGTRSGTHG